MKYILSLITVIAASMGLYAATEHDVADYHLEVNDFERLKVTDAINVVYHCSEDSAGWAYFTCEPDIARRLLFTNDKSRLQIQVDFSDDPTRAAYVKLPTLHLYSRSLSQVENAADSTVTVYMSRPVQSFKARIVGNGTLIVDNLEAASVDAGINTGKGHLVISGHASRAKLSNVGTGPMEAGGLHAATLKVMMLGTGNIDCYASQAISIYGAGSGKVYYAGNPEKVTNRSLGVKAVAIDHTTAD